MTQVCTNPECEKGLEPQPIDNFYLTGTSRKSRRSVCKRCVIKGQQSTRDRTTKKNPVGFRGRGNVALTPLDLVPCSACWLRGHVAMDPEKCPKAQPLELGTGYDGFYAPGGARKGRTPQ